MRSSPRRPGVQSAPDRMAAVGVDRELEVAAILERPGIEKILAHLGLEPEPKAPVR